MATIKAYGIIPIKEGKTLLIKHQKGHWAFPKGHPNLGESAIETAKRELFEETGLSVKQLFSKQYSEHYEVEGVDKEVTYFFARVEGNLKLQTEEVAEARWLTPAEAVELATFKECKNLIQKAFNLCTFDRDAP